MSGLHLDKTYSAGSLSMLLVTLVKIGRCMNELRVSLPNPIHTRSTFIEFPILRQLNAAGAPFQIEK